MISVLISALALSAAANDPGGQWATLSKSPALRRTRTTVDIGTLGYNQTKQQLEYWLRRTVSQGGAEQVAWTESQSCAAVRPVIKALQGVAVPRLQIPGYSNESEIVLDGVGYSLKAPSTNGTISFDTNVGSSLAKWIEESLTALEPCWTTNMPVRVDRN